MSSAPEQNPAEPSKVTTRPADADPRAARLKAALKANLGRRKAQARARTADDPQTGPEGGNV